MNHPWRRQQFGKFVKQQEHHQNDQDTKIASRNEAHQYNKPQQKAGANTSIILGHFQKRLTSNLPLYALFPGQ